VVACCWRQNETSAEHSCWSWLSTPSNLQGGAKNAILVLAQLFSRQFANLLLLLCTHMGFLSQFGEISWLFAGIFNEIMTYSNLYYFLFLKQSGQRVPCLMRKRIHPGPEDSPPAQKAGRGQPKQAESIVFWQFPNPIVQLFSTVCGCVEFLPHRTTI
jgi:hypothetical protein